MKKWLLYFSLAILVVLLSAEKFDLLRSDSISAVACTQELFADKPDDMEIIVQYRDAIATAAQSHDLPPEFLAAIINGHQRDLTPFRKFTDCAGSGLGTDLSLGLAQVRLSTAAANDELEFSSVSATAFKRYRSLLLDEEDNITYQARELRRLLERDNRFPGITAEGLIQNPFAMTLVMSEYRSGPQDAPSTSSRLSGIALFDLAQLLKEGLYIFDKDFGEAIQARTAIEEYLDYVHCDKEMFTLVDCRGWRKMMNL